MIIKPRRPIERADNIRTRAREHVFYGSQYYEYTEINTFG